MLDVTPNGTEACVLWSSRWLSASRCASCVSRASAAPARRAATCTAQAIAIARGAGAGLEPAPVARPDAPASAQARCGSCGRGLAEDQEWCLECGTARTLLRRPPDWRIPVALVAAVILLVVIAVLIALASLSIQANRI